MGKLVGIDEAGRGPLIGPMVMAALMVEDEEDLPSDLKDSKLLSPAQRERLYGELDKFSHVVSIVSTEEIDEYVKDKRLNWLEAEKTVDMLRNLKPDKAIIDCPARNLEEYKRFIQRGIPGVEILLEYKADARHAVVAAASIIAKVTRDRIVEDIKAQVGIDFGSGYPSDPKTQQFLRQFPQDFKHFRKSWQPYKDRLAESKQKTLF